jgi:hypothetical protein
MFPLLLIVIGIAVLALGKRLAVLGAAVGALLGVGLLKLFPGDPGPWITLGVPIALALVGFFGAAFAKGLIDIIVLVLGALAGAAIVLGFLDLFNVDAGLMRWLLAVVGGVVGLILMRRGRKGSQDWGIIILAGLVGALLVTRGLTILLPVLQGVSGTLIVIVLAGVSIAFQGGKLGKRKGAAQAQPAAGAGSPPPSDNPPAPPASTN